MVELPRKRVHAEGGARFVPVVLLEVLPHVDEAHVDVEIEEAYDHGHHEHIGERPFAEESEPVQRVAPQAGREVRVVEDMKQQQLQMRPHEGEGEEDHRCRGARVVGNTFIACLLGVPIVAVRGVTITARHPPELLEREPIAEVDDLLIEADARTLEERAESVTLAGRRRVVPLGALKKGALGIARLGCECLHGRVAG